MTATPNDGRVTDGEFARILGVSRSMLHYFVQRHASEICFTHERPTPPGATPSRIPSRRLCASAGATRARSTRRRTLGGRDRRGRDPKGGAGKSARGEEGRERLRGPLAAEPWPRPRS